MKLLMEWSQTPGALALGGGGVTDDEGRREPMLGFGRLGGAITHSTPVKAALISLVP